MSKFSLCYLLISCEGVRMSAAVALPCPVRLGSIRSGGVAAQLHQFTRERNLHKAEKLLKQGKTQTDVQTGGVSIYLYVYVFYC